VITNPAYVISDRERINHQIVDLEYALAVYRAVEQMTPRVPNFRVGSRKAKEWVQQCTGEWIKQRARLAAAVSAIERTLVFLRELRIRSKR
jgi:hypothetical protein